MSYLYIVRVYENGETMDYEYSNMKHAREHYNTDKANRVDLVEYCWNVSTHTGAERIIDSRGL